MAEHPNVTLIKQVYEAFGKGDMDTLTRLFADDLVYHAPGNNPLSGDYNGRDAVFGSLFAKSAEISGGTFRVSVHDVLANDDHAIALTHYDASRPGKVLSGALECHVFHVRNNQVVEIWQFLHDLAGFDHFWS